MVRKTRKKINFDKLLKGNNRCTLKCSKSAQNIYNFLKKSSVKFEKNIINEKKKVMKKKITPDKYLINIFDRYNGLIDKVKKRKYYNKYLECTCKKCKTTFKDTENNSKNIINFLQIIDSNFEENIQFKNLLDNAIDFSKKITTNLENACKDYIKIT